MISASWSLASANSSPVKESVYFRTPFIYQEPFLSYPKIRNKTSAQFKRKWPSFYIWAPVVCSFTLVGAKTSEKVKPIKSYGKFTLRVNETLASKFDFPARGDSHKYLLSDQMWRQLFLEHSEQKEVSGAIEFVPPVPPPGLPPM